MVILCVKLLNYSCLYGIFVYSPAVCKYQSVFLFSIICKYSLSHGAKRPCLPWKGVAERSESFKIMIAGGNHSTVKRWLSVSETGGVCASTERCEKTPQSAYGCQLQLCIKHLYAAQAATAAKPFRGALGKTGSRYHSTSRSIPLDCGRLAYAIWEPHRRLTFHRNICKMWK